MALLILLKPSGSLPDRHPHCALKLDDQTAVLLVVLLNIQYYQEDQSSQELSTIYTAVTIYSQTKEMAALTWACDTASWEDEAEGSQVQG